MIEIHNADCLEYMKNIIDKTIDMIVLDNCMGSGTTGVACQNTNRNFIGIEINKDTFEIAKKRLNI